MKDLISEYKKPFNEVFPINEEKVEKTNIVWNKGNVISRKIKVAKPRILIPIFTGAHGEYDMGINFKMAGGIVDYFVFKTSTSSGIRESYKALSEKIKNYQIIGFPNGSFLGDEPEAGGKLMKIILRNPNISEEIMNHLYRRDGLILGVGGGFLGLMKSGLIQYGEIRKLDDSSVNIASNKNGEFLSKIVDIKVVSNLSPWLNGLNVGDIFTSPIATKEGRVVGELDELIYNGQIAAVYAEENPTGSNMGIDSITSPDGRILGTVSSIDRNKHDLYKNIGIRDLQHNIFKSGIKYFD